jgi:hypothetical protein
MSNAIRVRRRATTAVRNSSRNPVETGGYFQQGQGKKMAKQIMALAKWLGILVVSVVTGLVPAGLAQLAMPSLPSLARILIEIGGVSTVLRAMVTITRLAATIEPHHGKQFD